MTTLRMRHFVLAVAFALSGGVGCNQQPGSEGKAAQEKAAPVLDKKIADLTADDLKRAIAALGYEQKSASGSGTIITALGTKGSQRLTLTLWGHKEEKQAKERAEIEGKNGAARVDGTRVLIVTLEPTDLEAAKKILTQLIGD